MIKIKQFEGKFFIISSRGFSIIGCVGRRCLLILIGRFINVNQYQCKRCYGVIVRVGQVWVVLMVFRFCWFYIQNLFFIFRKMVVDLVVFRQFFVGRYQGQVILVFFWVLERGFYSQRERYWGYWGIQFRQSDGAFLCF